MRTTSGHTVAIELELTGKQRTRRESILGAYAAEARIDAVLYLSDRPSVLRSVQDSARQLGIASLVHVQRCEFGPTARVPGTARARERARGRAAEAGR